MRISRQLTLLALAGLAALAFATPANAAVTVSAEGGAACPDVSLVGHTVSGGCLVHVVGEQETQIVAGTAGGPVVISTCEDEFEAHIDSAGEGYIDVVNVEDHDGPACTRTACDEAEPSHATIPWRIHIREEDTDTAMVSFCLRNETTAEGTAGTPCEVNIPWSQTSNPHRLSFDAEGGAGCHNLPPGAVTVFGHWHTETDSETHPEVVVSH
jgi:hypothetical protein